MPGLTGIIAKDLNRQNGIVLDQMVNCMRHEKFHNSGTYIAKQLGLRVGWVCHEGSFSDCLPVWDETREIFLVFSGEDFTEQTEIDHLRARGHRFDSRNGSYLVHLYEELGLKFAEKLNGWFSGVLVDFREEKIVLFNDRYGLERIYFHEDSEAFYFSSEAKSLLKVLPQVRELDPVSVGELFSCGCVLQNRTLFSGISLMPGSSMWIFSRNQRVEKRTYFSLELWENQTPLSGLQYYERLRETFERVLPRYLREGERVGVSLTGGVDSRMIMAWAGGSPGQLPCYTFGSTFRDCNDVRVARQVAKVCKQSHQVIPVERDFLSQFPNLAEKVVYVTDGTMDVSGSVELFINRMARKIAPIRMTGKYGGEILRGIVAFKPHTLNEGILDHELAHACRTAARTYACESRGRRLSFIAFKQVPWYHYAILAVERSQLTLRSPYLDNDLVALAYQTPSNLATSNEPSLRLVADGNPALSRIATDLGVLWRSIPLIDKLRQLYQRFTFKAEYAYDYGMPQWLASLDRILSPMHPERLFLGRHKFYHFRIWYRDELSQYVKDILLDSRTRGRPYLNGSCLEKIVTSHVSGSRNYTREIHRILTSELIHRQLIESS
jgi:asparagine synthase (glutamine-hydrolysing)